MELFYRGFLLAVTLVIATAAVNDDICIELDSDSSNRELGAQIYNLYVIVAKNAGKPQPELNLPVVEPLTIKSAGPLKARDTNGRQVRVALGNIVSLGLSNTVVPNVKVTGTGSTRSVSYIVNLRRLTLSAAVRISDGREGKRRTESLNLEAKNVRFRVTGQISPKKTSIQYSLVAASSFLSKKPSSLDLSSQKQIFAKVISTAYAHVDATCLEAALEHDCDDSGERRVAVRKLVPKVKVPRVPVKRVDWSVENDNDIDWDLDDIADGVDVDDLVDNDSKFDDLTDSWEIF